MTRTASAREPVAYMERTRRFYEAQGYERPYEWARFDDVPFARLPRPLSKCTVGLVTTASPVASEEERALRDPKRVRALGTKAPPARMYTDDLAWDKEATHTEDLDSFLPVHRLQELARAGAIGRLAERFYCVPTEYSQRKTREQDAPAILELCREDGVDVALLVPL